MKGVKNHSDFMCVVFEDIKVCDNFFEISVTFDLAVGTIQLLIIINLTLQNRQKLSSFKAGVCLS